jgi:hypothetical protein
MLKIKELFQLHLKKNINVLIFFLLSSFLLGNIFGLNSKFFLFQSPEILLFFVPLLIEILNLLTYNFKQKFSNRNRIFILVIISIRRGFFLGIFIEAFKLGS